MTRTRSVLLALLACALLAPGCLGRRPAPRIRYYTVALTPEGVRLPVGVRVTAVGAAPAYRTTRIALRRSRYRLEYYDFNRWAANPPSLLAAAMQTYFDRVGEPADPRPIHVSGRIERLEAVATSTHGLRAVATITFEAHGAKGPLVDRTYRERVPVQGRDPEDVVAALSRALERILARFSADLAAAVRAAPAGRAGTTRGRNIEMPG